MGYYTNYTLTINDVDQDIVLDILSHSIPEWVESGSKTLAEILDIEPDDEILEKTFIVSAKWYDYEADLLFLSEAYPSAVFRLVGIGEDREDSWIAYYQNGKTYNTTIEFVPFDPDALVKPNPRFLRRTAE
jgi:hypothetical protein